MSEGFIDCPPEAIARILELEASHERLRSALLGVGLSLFGDRDSMMQVRAPWWQEAQLALGDVPANVAIRKEISDG